jgi:hypothetical protein
MLEHSSNLYSSFTQGLSIARLERHFNQLVIVGLGT